MTSREEWRARLTALPEPMTGPSPWKMEGHTTFRRRVRRWAVPVSLDVPFDVVQTFIRNDLNRKKHTVVENSWTDDTGQTGDDFIRNVTRRVVTVRYVTGGMRHKLGESIKLQPQVSIIEFSRAHGREVTGGRE